MSWSISTWAKLIVAMTLFVAAFVIAPAVDAATCAPEAPAAHASVDHDSGDGDHGGREHGLCSHGHCHLAGTARADAGDAEAPVYLSATHAIPNDQGPASKAPDGLKRPPRA